MGITGPRDGQLLAEFPALTGVVRWDEFLDQYGHLDADHCEVFDSEVNGIGCAETCDLLIDRCGTDRERCLEDCAPLPRSRVDCVRLTDTCDFAECSWL